MNDFLVWWALPALCVLLACLQIDRSIEDREPGDIAGSDWMAYLIGSALWPAGVVAIAYTLTGPFCRFLTKERRWFK